MTGHDGTRGRRWLPLLAAVALVGVPVTSAGEPAAEGDSARAGAEAQPTVRTTNLVPQFLEFHAEGRALEEAWEREVADREPGAPEPDREAFLADLHELWDEHLGEATSGLARAEGVAWSPVELDEAWARYGQAMDRIRGATSGLTPDPEGVLRQVGSQLRLDRPLEIHLILYVGTFQDRPAFRLRNDEFAVLVPVEVLQGPVRPLLVDLTTRAVQARMAGRPSDGELSLAQHLFVRGLALRVYEEMNPGRPAEEYLGRARGWLLQAEQRDGAIMDGIRQRLRSRDAQVLRPYLEAGGVTGMSGEFDYGAWRVSGLLLLHGWTLDRLARVPIHEIDDLVAEILGA
jgi:hypothetical protein